MMEVAMVLAVFKSWHGRIQQSWQMWVYLDLDKDLFFERNVFIKDKAKIAG